MSTVYIDHRNADIDVDGDRLVVRVAGERKGTVPLRLVERVVVASSARLASRMITRLKSLGIGLVVAGTRFGQGAVGVVAASGDTARRLGQYELARDPARRLVVARELVARKIDGQAALLHSLLARRRGEARLLADGRGRLLAAAEHLRNGSGHDLASLLGHEGASAAAYFAAFATAFAPALQFGGRNRRPPRDPVNVCLSIGYTMLHFEALQAAVRAGLDPLIGVYHDARPGRDSLACDLVEPVRVAVDGFVHDLFAENVLRPENFTSDGERCTLGKAGRTAFYRAFEEQAATAVREGVAAEAAAIAAAVGDRPTSPLALPLFGVPAARQAEPTRAGPSRNSQ